MPEHNVVKLVLLGWRERWTPVQWGAQCKIFLGNGVSGDQYNLAECLLQHALVGPILHPLFTENLKHSLSSGQISHAAVIKNIAKYEHLDRVRCISGLLNLLNTIFYDIVCREVVEENCMSRAVLDLAVWLLRIMEHLVVYYEKNRSLNKDQTENINQVCALIHKFLNDKYLSAILYVASFEYPELYKQLIDLGHVIKSSITRSNFEFSPGFCHDYLTNICKLTIDFLGYKPRNIQKISEHGCGIQQLLAVGLYYNPLCDTLRFATKLQMLKRMKKISIIEFIQQIIISCIISITNSIESNKDIIWGPFTFFRLPYIIKQLYNLEKNIDEKIPSDYTIVVVDVLEGIINDNAYLDNLDNKSSCNFMEYLLKEWSKQNFLNEMHVKHLLTQREASSKVKYDVNAKSSISIINYVHHTEYPLTKLLKTLNSDYIKVQETLLSLLSQVLIDDNLDVLLFVAAMEGSLKSLVSGLLRCNEKSLQVPGEVGKPLQIRSTLFDLSFLILTYIVQIYGSNEILNNSGETFFEKWAVNDLIENSKNKNPINILSHNDEISVEELLKVFKNDGQFNKSNITYQIICKNIPNIFNQVVLSWSHECISSVDVKTIVENIKKPLLTYIVCSNEYFKGTNIIHELMIPSNSDDMACKDIMNDALNLLYKIIRKMPHNIPSNQIPKSNMNLSTIDEVNLPNDIFEKTWSSVVNKHWLSIKNVEEFINLTFICKNKWVFKSFINEMEKCKSPENMEYVADTIFAILHFDDNLNMLNILPKVFLRTVENTKRSKNNYMMFLKYMANICAAYLISTNEQSYTISNINHKRRRSHDNNSTDTNVSKVRKLTIDSTDDTINTSNDPSIEQQQIISQTINNTEQKFYLNKTPLEPLLIEMFYCFENFLNIYPITPRIDFIHEFLLTLIEYGKDHIYRVMNIIPQNIISHLLKIKKTDKDIVAFICRLHDVQSSHGRAGIISNLNIWRLETMSG